MKVRCCHKKGVRKYAAMNLVVIIDRCLAFVTFFIWTSDGLVATCKLEIHFLIDSSAGSRTLFSSGIVVRSFVRSFAFSFKYR